MAWDDPVVWILIIAVVVFLFGSSKIPALAKSLGQAKKEFDEASKGLKEGLVTPPVTNPNPSSPPSQPVAQVSPVSTNADPLIVAAQNEGIETQGKTRDQIATELAWKLNKK